MTEHIPALSCGLVGFDTETTGPNPHEDELVTAAIVLMGPTGRLRKRLTWLVRGDREICEAATAVHGITNEQRAADGLEKRSAIEAIAGILRAVWSLNLPVVIYNAPFDITLLNAELARLGRGNLFDGVENPLILDPFVLDRVYDKFRAGSRKLVCTAQHYGVDLHEDDAHDACADAIAACHVAMQMYVRYPALQRINAVDIMSAQRKWFYDQMTSLEAFKRRNDPAFTAGKEWPLQGLMGKTTPRGAGNGT